LVEFAHILADVVLAALTMQFRKNRKQKAEIEESANWREVERN
jgi:hypothetical protein